MKRESKIWYKQWWAIVLFIILAWIVIGYIIPNSLENQKAVLDEKEASKALIEDYTRHMKLLDEDRAELSDLYAQWNIANNYSNPDINYTKIYGIGYLYEYKYKFAIAHLDSAREFIVANEEELKQLGIDTFQKKKEIDEEAIRLTEPLEGIKEILEIVKGIIF
jgi:hypothetical protein